MKQSTLHDTFSIEGKGLHTGVLIHATFRPAAENTGIRICRVDLPERPCYEALVTYVTQTSRGTVLENGKWKVSTVEHMLSALYAMGITNCLVEVDAAEIPILDGSAMPYVREIERVGIRQQQAKAKEWVVQEPITFSRDGSQVTITPADRYEVHVHVDYPSEILHIQEAELLMMENYSSEIAPARTFCFLREIEWLLHLGLIKGGDLKNAIVIYDKRISQWSLNRLASKLCQPPIDAQQLGYLTPLIFENEPARHKLLDLIGDFALLGCQIKGRISASCPGHGFNTYCCKQLRPFVADTVQSCYIEEQKEVI